MSTGWVIGGTSGIGQQTALYMSDFMDVVVDGHETFDVRQPMSAFRNKIQELQFPRYIVYSAGINYLEWLGHDDPQDSIHHADVIDVNLTGFIRFIDALAFYKPFYKHDPPSIVAVSSDASERPLRTSISYCASKAGLNQAVRVAARELGPRGWRINAVSPGMTEPTEMQKYIDERVPDIRGWTPEEAFKYEKSQEVVPGRISVGEVAQVVCQTLLGPKHLNGSIITLNGGR